MPMNFLHKGAVKMSNTTLLVKFPHFSDYQSRLDSFEDWPLKCVAQKPEMMAKSGFYYFGSADRARCFHCGVTLRDWDTDDYPPCAHKQWSQHCPFVQQLDIEEMIEEIEDWERMEKAQREYDHSVSYNCTSNLNMTVCDEDVSDGAGGTTSTGADNSLTSVTKGNSPSVEAVLEMGYTREIVGKAVEIRRRQGCSDPDAVSILKAILDME